MKLVQLIHNPGAGAEEYDKEELEALLKENGYKCEYLSLKQKGWKDFDTHVDILLIAGGDGTIRKVAEEILEARLLDKPGLIAILPLGTANNIAKALEIKEDAKEAIRSWQHGKIKSFDVGRVFNVAESKFFLESFGYGAFPYLMQEMKKLDQESFPTPEAKMNKALELLHQITLSYEPRFCKLEVDGTDHSGKFLLAEIMNTPSIGPNLAISPLSNPDDGEFEVVLVPELHKEKFAAYIAGKRNGQQDVYSFHTLKGKNIKISWEGTHVHIDDQIVTLEKAAEVTVQLKRGLLDFLVQ